MIVRILSKEHFDTVLPRMRIDNLNVEEHLDKAFISILDPDRPNSSYFIDNHPNVLRLVFADETPDGNYARIKKGLNECQLFTRQQGEEILNFVERNKHIETLFIHCSAGISRSGAVGLVINDYYGEETYMEFGNSNTNIRPNFYIVALLRRIYNGIGDE